MSGAPGVRLARPEFDINHVIAYGQSLACGYEGWPALSVTARADSVMLGESVRSAGEQHPFWHVLGEVGFRPLVATVQDIGSGALLSPAEVAGLAPGTVVMGETVLEGAVNSWRAHIAGTPGWRAGSRLLASSCGIGGRTLEALSRGAEIELFQRLRDCAAAARAAASARGLSYGVTALLFLQGEQNNWGLDGGTTDRAGYKALMLRFYDDFVAEVAIGIAGQTAVPAMFMYQTGGDYASEHMAIPQAQLEVALERPAVFLAAPSYPVTSKVGHLDAHGYRWLGAQFGKVMHRVLTLGLDWRPLYPLRASVVGRRVYADFHVPVPPLAWGRPFQAHAAQDVANRGFSVRDAAGAVAISAVALDGATAVRIELSRAPVGGVFLRYADRAHAGRGSLHDSDATVADDVYEYAPGVGHYPDAAIDGLVGRPYPLMNWCVGFEIGAAVVRG